MLTQAELNFYGYNQKNIIKRQTRGKITALIKYDSAHKYFVVTRRTPKTLWEDRYKNIEDAKKRFYEFVYMTNSQLENKLVGGCI